MAIINLLDQNKNFEEIKVLSNRIFKKKEIYTTDINNNYNVENTEGFILDNYPDSYSTSYGLLSLFSYNTNTIKEINGNTQKRGSIFSKLLNSNISTSNISTVFDNNTINYLGKVRPDLITQINNNQDIIEIDSNYFSIKRLSQELNPFSNIITKKNIIKNLYKSNNNMTDSKFNQQFNYSFYNYNCLNFFNILPSEQMSQIVKDEFINNSHKNILIYSNTLLNNIESGISQSNVGLFDNKMSINFWINPKRTSLINKKYNPGCILHIPNIISIYLVPDDINYDFFNRPLSFKILCHLGEKANILPSSNEITNEFKILSNDILKLNTWHNVSIIITGSDVLLYIDSINNLTSWKSDNKSIDLYSLNFNNSKSIFTIGNRLSNQNEIWQLQYENKLKNSFFNDDTYLENNLNIDEINEVNNIKFPNSILNINTKILNNNESNVNIQSQALNAELNNIMIFNNEISFQDLFDYSVGNKNLELSNRSLSFWLPCIYLPELVRRKGYITLGMKDNISYRAFVNPYFSHKIYGHELSIEHFLRDLAFFRLPLIKGMNGKEYNGCLTKNFYNESNISNNVVKNEKKKIINDFYKGHKTPTQILNKIMTTDICKIDGSFIDYQFDNLIYRNNFIFPCDNGKVKIDYNNIQKYNKIKNILLSESSISHYFLNKNFNYINLQNSLYLNDDEYSYDEPINFFNKDYIYNTLIHNSNNLYINKPNKNEYLSKVFIDKLSNYHIQKKVYDNLTDSKLSSQLDINNFWKDIKNSIESQKYLSINQIFKNIDEKYTPSNPELIISTKSINGKSVVYRKFFNSYYSIEGELGETYSTIFDISNLFYSSKIHNKSIEINDFDLNGTGAGLSMKIKDNGMGLLYRADCNGEHAKWAHIGHIFYSDGLCNILYPGIANFGENNFSFSLKGQHSMYTMELNIPVDKGDFNISSNKTFIKDLKPSNSLSDLEEDQFVYISGVNLHDENLNIVAKANFAQPIVKRLNDRYNIKLKMDF
jgi:hypothetical protein